MPDEEFDVAISFLSADCPTAEQIADRLTPLNVFFFPRNQEEVAGTDGMESFRDAFRNNSRIQVVLYRAAWGETPWTRVEATAIQERCLAEGWRGLFFVALGARRTWRQNEGHQGYAAVNHVYFRVHEDYLPLFCRVKMSTRSC